MSLKQISAVFLKKPVILGTSLLIAGHSASMQKLTQGGIPIDVEWKQKVYAYAQDNIKHSAWGIAHSERDYLVSVSLAKSEDVEIDTDVIFAAAFLHDIGAIEPFRKKDVDHAVRSVEIVEQLLATFDFPMQKWPKVKGAILGHMYYAKLPEGNEARVLHDADTLDFLGIIGTARILSITERHAWAPNLPDAVNTIGKFKNELPNSLITATAKKIAAKRVAEMEEFIDILKQETFDGRSL